MPPCVHSPRSGRLVYLPLTRLLPLLSILLALITIHTPLSPPSSVILNPSESAHPQFHPIVDPVPIEKALHEEHGVDQEIFHGVKALFGRSDGGFWVVDIRRIVIEMGKGMLLEENVCDSRWLCCLRSGKHFDLLRATMSRRMSRIR